MVARDPDRPNEAAAIVRNRLWVHGDDVFCVTRLINRGNVVDGNTVTVEFAATGVVQSYLCSLDRTEYFECEYKHINYSVHYISTYIHKYVRAYIHTYIHTYIHMYVHTV